MDNLEFYQKIEEKIDKRMEEVRIDIQDIKTDIKTDIKDLGKQLIMYKSECDRDIDDKIDKSWFKWVVTFMIIAIISIGGYAAAINITANNANVKIEQHLNK